MTWTLRIYEEDGDELLLEVPLPDHDRASLARILGFAPHPGVSSPLPGACFLDCDASSKSEAPLDPEREELRQEIDLVAEQRDMIAGWLERLENAAREVVKAFDAYQPGGGLRLPNGAVRYAKALAGLRAALDNTEPKENP